MNFRTLLITVWALALANVAYAQAPQPAAPQQAAPTLPGALGPTDTSTAYVLGRDDAVEVGLLGGAGFGGRARVQADGTIQLPFVGKIQAADRTTAELADVIRKALQDGKYFQDPVVTVEVVGYASRYVTLLGAVGQPGLIPMNRPYRLSEILARVGGVRGDAADYIVVRPATGPEKRYLVRELATGDVNQDPFVAPGDKIYAPTAELYYISGQVKAPGAYPIQTGMTVRMALAKAGGLTESGSDKKIEASRSGKKVKVKIDGNVEAGDILIVGERLF